MGSSILKDIILFIPNERRHAETIRQVTGSPGADAEVLSHPAGLVL
jgi:hypothetical protein